jgi:hypothetical protein
LQLRLQLILPPLVERLSVDKKYREGERDRPMVGDQEQTAVAELLQEQVTPRNNTPPQQRSTRKVFPICLHQIQMEAQYDPYRHVDGAARFLIEEQRQRQKHERHENQGMKPATTSTKNYHLVTLLSIRRKSQLALWVMVLMQWAAVDEYWFLPTGAILYTVSLQIALEQWMNEIKENQRYQEEEQQHLERERRRQQEQQLNVQAAIQMAEFEYHVLRDQWDIEILPVYQPDTGGTTVYAVPPLKTLPLPFV